MKGAGPKSQGFSLSWPGTALSPVEGLCMHGDKPVLVGFRHETQREDSSSRGNRERGRSCVVRMAVTIGWVSRTQKWHLVSPRGLAIWLPRWLPAVVLQCAPV